MYMLNGLNEKFDNIINVIKHQKPFPSFDDAKSMLQDEESRLKKAHKLIVSHADHASSSTALIATPSPNQPPSAQPNQNKNNRSFRRNNNRNTTKSRNNNSFQNLQHQQRPPFQSGDLSRTGLVTSMLGHNRNTHHGVLILHRTVAYLDQVQDLSVHINLKQMSLMSRLIN